MKNIDFKAIFSKQWPHLVVIGLFFLITYIFFAPQFGGNSLRQSDVEQFKGMSHEIHEFREVEGEEPLWTNSMFGGMPAYQISVVYNDNWALKMVKFFRMGLNAPAGLFIVYLLGFYIMLMCMKVNPWLALFGAVAFALSSYFIIILEVGHNSKAAAIGLMPPVIGAFWMAFRGNLKWGIILSALFMSIQIGANHLQVTYYLGLILLFMGLAEIAKSAGVKEASFKNKLIFGGYLLLSFLLMFVMNSSATLILLKIAVLLLIFVVVGFYLSYKKGALKRLLVATFSVLCVYGFALVINYGNLSLTTDYAEYTIRGGNDLKLAPDGTENDLNSTEGGLDRDYVTRWSLGQDESLTLISPDAKGGATEAFDRGPYKDMFENNLFGRKNNNAIEGYPSYWGEQPGTSGPVYIGALIFLLMVLGMIYIKDPTKWALLAVSFLALALSWGKNYMGLTDFFLDYVPGYDKFRAVTIILVIVELCLPLIAVLYLQKLIKEREEIKKRILPFAIGTGSVLLLFVILLAKGDGTGYISDNVDMAQIDNIEVGVRSQIAQMSPEQQAQYGINPNDETMIQNIIAEQSKSVNDRLDKVVEAREMIYSSSIGRSILIVFFGAAFILLFVYVSSIPKELLIGLLTLVLLLDLGIVARQYLNSDVIESSADLKYYKQANRDNSLKKGDYIQWTSRFDQLYPLRPSKADMDVYQLETEQNPELKATIEKAVKNIVSQDPNKGESRRGKETSKDNQEYAKQFAVLNSNTNYRVYEPQGGFNSSRASYFHKSLGGYHGAKLRRIQNIVEYHLSVNNNKIFDMMNVRYILTPQGAQINPTAAGNAWFVKELSVKDTPDGEIRGLGKEFKLTNIADGKFLVNGEVKNETLAYGRERLQYVVGQDTVQVPMSNGLPVGMEVVFVQDINGRANLLPKSELDKDSLNSFKSLVSITVTDDFNVLDEAIVSPKVKDAVGLDQFSGEGTIKMTSYAPNALSYEVNNKEDQFAVFSEVYYPKGWNAYVDGKPAEVQRVNYTLRGLKIPAGAKKVEMKFEVDKFDNANVISLVCSIVLFGLVIFMFFKDFILVKKNDVSEVKKDVLT